MIAQVVSLVWQFRILSDRRELMHFQPGIYRLRRRLVRDMLAIGMSPFLMNLTACFIVILINKGLKTYGGDLMIGAYGIVNRLAFIFVMIVMGINQGMQPIAGYNFGAQQYDRVLKVLRLTIVCAVCVTSSGFVVGEFMPHLAVSLFTTDEELVRLAADGMRIVFLCFPIIGFQMVATNFSRVSAWPARRSSCRCRASWFSCCRACCSCPASSRPIPIGAAAGACGAPCPCRTCWLRWWPSSC